MPLLALSFLPAAWERSILVTWLPGLLPGVLCTVGVAPIELSEATDDVVPEFDERLAPVLLRPVELVFPGEATTGGGIIWSGSSTRDRLTTGARSAWIPASNVNSR
jgi:hypothetical protein